MRLLPAAAGVLACSKADAVWFTTVHSFDFGSGGSHPQYGLIQGVDGNFYGTTAYAAAPYDGTVFEISPDGSSFNTVHSFSPTPDGGNPNIIQGSDGNLYGTTSYALGGYQGYGTIFQLTTSGSLTTLYSFANADDGGTPTGLIEGGDGNLYGTARLAGEFQYGTFFQVTTSGSLTTLHAFNLHNGVTGDPTGSLITGTDGLFYGTSEFGPTVYGISTSGSFSSIHDFNPNGSEGAQPGGLILGADGNFYGTTNGGGGYGAGTIFRLTASGSLTTLYTFTAGRDGAEPTGLLAQGKDGALYGTTPYGGGGGNGVIYSLNTSGSFTVLHSFGALVNGTNADGAQPNGLIMGAGDVLYGTTQNGGSGGAGTVFTLDLSDTGNCSVQVNLVPPTAQWQVDGGPWQQSGQAVGRLPPGGHIIAFAAPPGYVGGAPVDIILTGTATYDYSFPALAAALNSYWPLNDGDQTNFVYHGHQPFTVSVAATGTNAFALTEQCPLFEDILSLTEDLSNCYMGYVNSQNVPLTYTPAFSFVNAAILQNGGRVGSSAVFSFETYSLDATMFATVTDAGTVTAPAGTFRFCRNFAITQSTKLPNGKTSVSTQFAAVLAPGVGMIKALVDPGIWAVLVSGTVGGQPVRPYNVIPGAGKYTAVLTATNAGARIPQGAGYATMTIGPGGGVVFGGRLPDGESFSDTGLLVGGTSENELVISKSLAYPDIASPGATGSLSGTLTFVQAPGSSDFSGTLEWIKPAQRGGLYPGAIDTNLNVIGSVYSPPHAGWTALPGFDIGELVLSDTGAMSLSGTAALTQGLTLEFSNRLILSGVGKDGLKVTLAPSTGVFKGTFLYPGQRTPTAFGGVLFQDRINGAGLFIGPAGSGTVTLKAL